MALDPLATAADLSARGGDVTDTVQVDALLRSASAIVREAAGVAITSTALTLTLTAQVGNQWLTLPVSPVTGVSSVLIDGAAVSDYRLVDGALWRSAGWSLEPGGNEVDLTVGYATAPDDIVDLVCTLVQFGQALAVDGSRAGIAYDRIDDAQTGYTQGDAAVWAMQDALTDRTRAALRERFSGGAHVTGGR